MNIQKLNFLDESLKEEREYWLNKLAGSYRPSRIPLDFAFPEKVVRRAASLIVELTPDIEVKLLKACANSEMLALTMVIAAVKTCLHKYTRAEDIIIGTSINHAHNDVAELNRALILHDRIRPDATAKQTLLELKATLVEAYRNQKYPFERILEWLGVEQPPNREPLFDVVVILDYETCRENVGNLKQALTFIVGVKQNAVSCSIDYNAALLRSESVKILGEHFKAVLAAFLENPDVRIGDIDLMSPIEKQELVYEFNDSRRDIPGDRLITDLFEEQVRLSPGNIAAMLGDDSLTYDDLNVQANKLAHYLIKQGVKPGRLVGIYLDHSFYTLVAILGTLKSGAAYVPLDADYPKNRLAFIISDADIEIVLTRSTLADAVAGISRRPIFLDREEEMVRGESSDCPACGATPSGLAYVIYTSGSTGQPKGVAIKHSSLVNYIWWAKQVYLGNENLASALYSSLAFDLTVTSIYMPLVTGNIIVIYPRSDRESPILDVIDDNRVGVLKLTPSHLSMIIERIAERKNQATRVKKLIVGGEAFHTELARQAFNSFGGRVEIFNEYGPTEAAVGCMIHKFDPASDTRAFVPIGRPAANTKIYLLDERLEPVVKNAVGEIYISGAGLAEGYINREELTRTSFIDDPFEKGARMYKTGDLARWLAEGILEYLGRADEQVKYHGYRVELNEIRVALNRRPDVRDSVIVIRPEKGGSDVMIAYYASRQEIEPSRLREFLKEQVIEQIIPSIFVHLKRLPLTTNGKIDLTALPKLEEIRSRLKREYVAPAAGVESTLAEIWSEILGVERIGRQDNFFSLGGHSLVAAQVISRIRSTFQIELPMRALIESPTIADLSKVVRKAMAARETNVAPPVLPAPRTEDIPLSFAQQSLWLACQLDPHAPSYNVPISMRIDGDLNVIAFEQAVEELIRRHESLRTTFRDVNGVLRQVIHDIEPPVVSLTYVTDCAEDARSDQVARLSVEQFLAPFDLSTGPLLRVSLLRLAERRHVLLANIHHIVCDGWSMWILIREIAELYESFAGGRRSPLEPLLIQYADFAVWQKNWLRGETLESLLSYWRRHLAGAPSTINLPMDRPRAAARDYRGGFESFEVPPDLARALEDISQKEGVTLFMTLLGALQALLFCWTNQEDIVVGIDTAQRNRRETEGLIGFFVNMLIIRTILSPGMTFQELVQRVREVSLEAFANQDAPFEKLVEELRPERMIGQAPLFEVVFNYDPGNESQVRMADLEMSPIPLEETIARFALSLFIRKGSGGLQGFWLYRSALFEKTTVERLRRQYVNLLESVVAEPNVRLSHLQTRIRSEEEQPAGAKSDLLRRANLQKFRKAVARPIVDSSESLIETSRLGEGVRCPIIVQPAVAGLDLCLWVANNRELVERMLLDYGALLFRNFGITSIERFSNFTRVLSPELMEYAEASTPRRALAEGIYTSTEYPASQHILLHNELSYSHKWPMKIWFYCLAPPEQGGETPLADSRQVFNLVAPSIRDRFIKKGVQYVRNYGHGLGLPWQTVFRTSDRQQVESYCRAAGLRFEWSSDDSLRTWQVSQAVTKHPKTGEIVWFNQSHVHHISSVDPATREALITTAEDKRWPLDINAMYGDGSAIEVEVIDEIKSAYREATVSFPWQRGDVLMLDNMLTAHGRAPFVGDRKIIVAMAEVFIPSTNGSKSSSD